MSLLLFLLCIVYVYLTDKKHNVSFVASLPVTYNEIAMIDSYIAIVTTSDWGILLITLRSQNKQSIFIFNLYSVPAPLPWTISVWLNFTAIGRLANTLLWFILYITMYSIQHLWTLKEVYESCQHKQLQIFATLSTLFSCLLFARVFN